MFGINSKDSYFEYVTSSKGRFIDYLKYSGFSRRNDGSYLGCFNINNRKVKLIVDIRDDGTCQVTKVPGFMYSDFFNVYYINTYRDLYVSLEFMETIVGGFGKPSVPEDFIGLW